MLGLRRHRELDSFRRELLVGPLHVVGDEGDVRESADAILPALRREQQDTRLRTGNSQLDPPLRVVEQLACGDDEAELLGVESDRAILSRTGTLANLIPLIMAPPAASTSRPGNLRWPRAERAVQTALGVLAGRRLGTARRAGPTAVPEYTVHRPWARR
jgi:hypothetical protein